MPTLPLDRRIRAIADEYKEMSEGDMEMALYWACWEVYALGKKVSAGMVRATPEVIPLPKRRAESVDGGDDWVKTGIIRAERQDA